MGHAVLYALRALLRRRLAADAVITLLLIIAGLSAAVTAAGLLGLSREPVLWPLAAIAAGAAIAAVRREPCWHLPRPRFGWYPLLALPLVPWILLGLAPDREVDGQTYHLAIPWQMLQQGKLTWDGGQITIPMPNAIEMLHVYPLALGFDVGAHLVNWIPWIFALVVVFRWLQDYVDDGAALAGAIAVASIGTAVQLLPLSKNDLPAAAYVIAGMLVLHRSMLVDRGDVLASGLLIGMACAAKINERPFAIGILIWIAVENSRMVPYWLAGVAAMLLPCLVRAWAWTGSALWPMNSTLFPVGTWDSWDVASVAITRSNYCLSAAAIRDAILACCPAILLLPFVWPNRVFYGWPRPLSAAGRQDLGMMGAAMSGVVIMAWVFPPGWERHTLAGVMILVALAMRMARWVFRGFGWAAVCAIAILPACLQPFDRLIWSDACAYWRGTAGLTRYAAWQGRALSTLGEARQRMSWLQDPERDHGRVALLGDIRTHRFPVRAYGGRNYQRTVAWELAHDSWSPAEIAKRMRQRGIRWILYNQVTEGFPHPAARGYAWSARSLVLWRLYWQEYAALVWRSPTVDQRNGGFVIFAMRRDPVDPRRDWLPYLPGPEGVYTQLTSLVNAHEFLGAALQVGELLPRVDWIRNRIGLGYYATGDMAKAIEWYRPGYDHGTLDDGGWANLARAYERTGRHALAVEAARRTLKVCPDVRREMEKLKPAEPGATLSEESERTEGEAR